MYCNKENINILTSLMSLHGICHVVVCPGSRNAPLVHNFNESPSFVCHLVTDERSAGFYALGIAQQLSSPVAVCVTSGSAMLNLLPAVAEASYQNCGILVISADRPEAWIGQLDGQTMPQNNVFGSFAGKTFSLPEPKNTIEKWHCNRLVNEALLELKSLGRPSVHINVPVSEPLYQFDIPSLPEERMIKTEMTGDVLKNAKRPMIVLGQLPPNSCSYETILKLNSHFVVLSEPLSVSFRSCTEELVRFFSKELSPDLVIYVGGNTISKYLRHYLRNLGNDVFQIVVSIDEKLHDVSMNTSVLIRNEDPANFLNNLADRCAENTEYAYYISSLRRKISKLSDIYVPDFSGMLAVKMLEEISEDNIVYYANSLSVRYGMIFSSRYRFCNRGLNGIEGSLSVAAGASLVSDKLVYAVIGDLSFFYDENALWQKNLCGNFRILLLNNGGGGIFNGLQGASHSSAFNEYISAKHSFSAEGICHQFNVTYLYADSRESLTSGLEILSSKESRCPVLLEVRTDGNNDELVYEQYYNFIEHELDTDA